MKTFALFLIALLGIAQSSSVVDLNGENFDSFVDGSKAAFVEFFAPWCGHCKNLAPAYEQVGEAFAKLGDQVVIAKVDADQHRDLGSRFGISGFPTLKFFPKGSTVPEDYNGGRTAEEIVTYINNKAGLKARIKKTPSAVVDLDPSNFDKIVMDTSKDVLVEFYAPWCGHCKSLAPEYEKLANIYANEEGVVIAKIDADAHRDIGGKYGVSGFPTLKWFGKDSKSSPEDYQQGRDLASFVPFINSKTGAQRTVSGTYESTVGRIASLDEIAQTFASAADKNALVKKAETAAAALTGVDAKNAKIYLKTMTSIVGNADFVEKEIARLDGIINGGSISGKKVDEFTIRKNILAAFQ